MALDPSIVNLAKSMRDVESGGDYNAPGLSGERGGYQFMPDTWKNYAGKHLGDPNAPMTRQNQNKVTYNQIAEWKAKGFKPPEIVSMWNAGETRPNAYKEGHAGTNGAGVAYDTPAHVAKVMARYQQTKMAQGGQPGTPAPQPQNAPRMGAQTAYASEGPQAPQTQPQPVQPATQPPQSRPEKVDGFLNGIFGGAKIGEAIGAGIAGGKFGSTVQKFVTGRDMTPEEEATVEGPTGRQVVADTARVGLNFAPAVRIGSALKAGAQAVPLLNKVPNLAAASGTGAILSGAGSGLNQVAEGKPVDFGEVKNAALMGAAIPAPFAAGAAGLRRLGRETGEGRLADMTKSLSTLSHSLERNSKYTNVDGKRVVQSSPLTTFKNEGFTPKVVDGKVDTTEIREQLQEKIQQTAQQVRSMLKLSGQTVPFEKFAANVRTTVSQDPLLRNLGKTGTTLKQIEQILNSYRKSYGTAIPVTVIDDIRMAANTQFKDEVRDVYRAIGDAARKVVYDAVPDQQVKKLLAKEGEYISASNFAEVLQGKAVKGGRLGKYISQLIGGVAGASVGSLTGPLGTIAGAAAGATAANKVQDIAQRAYFKTPIANKARGLLEAGSKMSTPGDHLLGTAAGQRLERNVKESATNPAMGLSTRDVTRFLHPDDHNVMDAFIRYARDGERLTDAEFEMAEKLAERFGISMDDGLKKVASQFERILDGRRDFTGTALPTVGKR